MTDGQIWIVLANCPDDTVAESIGKEAIAAGLARMFNISAPIRSAYVWQGEIVETLEVQLSFKVRVDQRDALFRLVKAHHPFEVPSIVAWPIAAADTDYLKYVVGISSMADHGD